MARGAWGRLGVFLRQAEGALSGRAGKACLLLGTTSGVVFAFCPSSGTLPTSWPAVRKRAIGQKEDPGWECEWVIRTNLSILNF